MAPAPRSAPPLPKSTTDVALGGQLGCDYQFSPNWVVGIEGAASAGIVDGHKTVGLPAGNPGDSALVTVSSDLMTSHHRPARLCRGPLDVLWQGRRGLDQRQVQHHWHIHRHLPVRRGGLGRLAHRLDRGRGASNGPSPMTGRRGSNTTTTISARRTVNMIDTDNGPGPLSLSTVDADGQTRSELPRLGRAIGTIPSARTIGLCLGEQRRPAQRESRTMTILGYHSACERRSWRRCCRRVLAIAGHADEFQAKLTYCKTCHGLSGQGYHGYYAMPRLAGQQPKYIENQLRAFIEHRRKNEIMANVAHALSPSMLRRWLIISGISTRRRWAAADPSATSPRANGFSRRGFPNPTSPHARHATVRTPRVRTRFRASPASSLTTSTAS